MELKELIAKHPHKIVRNSKGQDIEYMKFENYWFGVGDITYQYERLQKTMGVLRS